MKVQEELNQLKTLAEAGWRLIFEELKQNEIQVSRG